MYWAHAFIDKPTNVYAIYRNAYRLVSFVSSRVISVKNANLFYDYFLDFNT